MLCTFCQVTGYWQLFLHSVLINLRYNCDKMLSLAHTDIWCTFISVYGVIKKADACALLLVTGVAGQTDWTRVAQQKQGWMSQLPVLSFSNVLTPVLGTFCEQISSSRRKSDGHHLRCCIYTLFLTHLKNHVSRCKDECSSDYPAIRLSMALT